MMIEYMIGIVNQVFILSMYLMCYVIGVSAKLAIVHTEEEIAILELIFSAALIFGSMYYSMVPDSSGGVFHSTCIRSISELEFCNMFGRSEMCVGHDLGYICYRIWLAHVLYV